MDITPEHRKRPVNDQEIDAAYNYVESVKDTADDKDKIMWHGWALREAFLAGISHNKKQGK